MYDNLIYSFMVVPQQALQQQHAPEHSALPAQHIASVAIVKHIEFLNFDNKYEIFLHIFVYVEYSILVIKI